MQKPMTVPNTVIIVGAIPRFKPAGLILSARTTATDIPMKNSMSVQVDHSVEYLKCMRIEARSYGSILTKSPFDSLEAVGILAD